MRGSELASAGDPNGTFADGWQVTFSHYIATLDKVSLWTDPDKSPTDQSQVGSLVAELDGPWAIDMHLNGSAFPYIDGKETGERAVAFAVLRNQNVNGGTSFPTDGTRLAVGFSAVTATKDALNVNLDADGVARYEYMAQNGCTVLYVGTATWKGDVKPGLCATPSADGGAPPPGTTYGRGTEPEFASIPRTIAFDLCIKPRTAVTAGSVETSYVNCDNQDNDPAPGLNGEPHARGIAFKSNTYTTGEVTLHTDHPFWESTQHDTPPRFDQFAAQVVGASGTPTVHFTDAIGVDYLGFRDRNGKVLPWRTCDPNYNNPDGRPRVGQMHFNPVSVPDACMRENPSAGLCDYYDFSKYNQSTQGHWNGADGLCFVERHYPSVR